MQKAKLIDGIDDDVGILLGDTSIFDGSVQWLMPQLVPLIIIWAVWVVILMLRKLMRGDA